MRVEAWFAIAAAFSSVPPFLCSRTGFAGSGIPAKGGPRASPTLVAGSSEDNNRLRCYLTDPVSIANRWFDYYGLDNRLVLTARARTISVELALPA